MDEEVDPGAVILFSSNNDIHDCLEVLVLPPDLPPLVRGMKIYFNNLLIYCGLLLSQHNPRSTLQNGWIGYSGDIVRHHWFMTSMATESMPFFTMSKGGILTESLQ